MQSIIRFFPSNFCARAAELLYEYAGMSGIFNSEGKVVVSPEKCIEAAQKFNHSSDDGEYFNNIIKTPCFTYEERDAIFGLVS